MNNTGRRTAPRSRRTTTSSVLLRHSRAAAFTLIEFLVAMSLTIGVLAAGSLAMASAERAMSNVRETDAATRIGYELLEKTRVFGCGRAVDGVTASAVTTACERALLNAGWELITGDYNGDFTISRKLDLRAAEESSSDPTGKAGDGSRTFTAKVQSVWGQPTVATDVCRSTALRASETSQPTLLRRTVTITTSGPLGDRTVTLGSVESLPNGSSYTGDGRGGVMVTGTAGNTVALTGSSSLKITKTLGPCTIIGQGGAWFPYLEPGTYSANGQQFTVTAGAVAQVNAGSVVPS